MYRQVLVCPNSDRIRCKAPSSTAAQIVVSWQAIAATGGEGQVSERLGHAWSDRSENWRQTVCERSGAANRLDDGVFVWIRRSDRRLSVDLPETMAILWCCWRWGVHGHSVIWNSESKNKTILIKTMFIALPLLAGRCIMLSVCWKLFLFTGSPTRLCQSQTYLRIAATIGDSLLTWPITSTIPCLLRPVLLKYMLLWLHLR